MTTPWTPPPAQPLEPPTTNIPAQRGAQMPPAGPPPPPPPAKRRKWPFVVFGVVVAIIVAAAIGGANQPATAPAASSAAAAPSTAPIAPSIPRMPILVGLPVEDVDHVLIAAGMDSHSTDIAKIPAGSTITEQTPSAGTEIAPGGRITLSYTTPDSAPAPASAAATVPAPAAAPAPAAPSMTVSQSNAVDKAESYLGISAFSRTGLIKQLKFEQFSTADATYAVDHVTVDWTEQADLKAKSYMEISSFSRAGLIKQLKFEGFTQAQAEHGAKSVGL